jgi:preprotein translocase subunit SecG
MANIMTVFIAVICVLLMAIILIQNPKGGGIDSTLGGGAANQMFGAAKSTDFVEKVTWGLAAALFILCLLTAIMSSGTAVNVIAPVQ